MKRQVKFLVMVMVVSLAFGVFVFSVPNTASVFSFEKPDVVSVVTKGKDLVDALNEIKGITLYDYAELYNNTIISVTFFIGQDTFKKKGFMGVKYHIVKILVTRYLNQDRERGVKSYMVGVLSNPNVVIEFELSGSEIGSLEQQFKRKFRREV